MDDATFILGLMKTNTAAVGFIPSTAIRSRWIRLGRYIIQRNSRGRPRGYLLHGPLLFGRPLFINQACIDYDHRLRGFGILAVGKLITKALVAGSTCIKLRCAMDLPANAFWYAAGFHATGYEPGGKQRNRTIVSYQLDMQDAPTGLTLPCSTRLCPRPTAEQRVSAD